MKFWFDTEFFEDGHIIELISIGIVAEDGRTYYAEVAGAEYIANKSDWLRENVQPHLTGDTKYRSTIREEIVEFVGENPEFWAYYASYDWVVLCQLFGRMIDLPKGWPMFVRDVKQLCVDCGNPNLPKQSGAEHSALADALWTRKAWDFLMRHDIANRLTSGLAVTPHKCGTATDGGGK